MTEPPFTDEELAAARQRMQLQQFIEAWEPESEDTG